MDKITLATENRILDLVNAWDSNEISFGEAKAKAESIAMAISKKEWKAVKAKITNIIEHSDEFAYSDLQGVVSALVMQY